MPSIHLPLDYYDWGKTRRLIQALGRGAAEMPIRLWCYCAQHPKEDGRLPGLQVSDIEAVMRWWGDRGRALEVMDRELFLLKEGPEYRALDWEVVGGHILNYHDRAVNAINQRWKSTPRNTPSNTPSIRGEGPGFHRFPSDAPLGPRVNTRRTA